MLVIVTAVSAGAADTKRVLVVHSFGSVAPPFTTRSTALESALLKQMGNHLDLDEVSLDMARYAAPDLQEALVAYLEKRSVKWKPDLVVPIGAPAGLFVAKFRKRLFSNTPILYCSMDRRFLGPDDFDQNTAFVGAEYKPSNFIEDILQIAPDTKNIAVVNGATPLEQYWTEVFRKGFEPFSNRVHVIWLNDLPFDQILERAKTLPPHSFIFLILFLRDAAGVTLNADEAMKRLHEVANAPINSIFDSQMGLGVVGGRLHSGTEEGMAGADTAVRILNGESPSNFPPKLVPRLSPEYDWRELQRWNIDERNLPIGSKILFRTPTRWEQNRRWIIGGLLILCLQGLLIVGLLANLIKRRRAEVFLTQSEHRFRTMANVLRESEARINLAVNAAHLGLWHCNVQDKELWVTEKWRQLFGFSESEPVTFDRLLHVVHPRDRERMKQLVQSIFKHGGESESEYRIKLPDGSTRWMSGYGTVELDERGRPAFARGVSRDITLRKHAEEELRESEARFRAMADTAPVMIWVSGPDRLCTFFNKGWLDFTGRSLEQELGNGWAEGVHPEDLDGCLDLYQNSFDARQSFTMEYRLRRSDGEYRLVLDTGTPRFAPDGTFLGYIGSCIDITQGKQAELERQRQNTELARVGRVALMGEFAASLAHEINNPVGAMVANANAGQLMLARGQLGTDEFRELLADIVSDGHRAREVIQGVRNMVRKGEMPRAVIRINDVLGDLLRIVRLDALERNVKIKQEISSNAGRVEANRVQLLQVLLNLTLNAFEAMSVNRPDARSLVISSNPGSNGEVVIQVRDHGPGFPGGIVEQLFEPFFSMKAQGTGMGLAIARSIVEAHGGTLSGENCDDGGACFTIRLPHVPEEKS